MYVDYLLVEDDIDTDATASADRCLERLPTVETGALLERSCQ
ncbi:hypothetical protein [Halomontanus rarus]